MSRRFVVGSSFAASLLFVGGAALAQQAAPKGPAQSSSQFTLRREEAGGPAAEAARGRARAGDCAGALSLFDTAIHATVEPTLRRDRGLCHEKLGNTFPAIEDYRAYLAARPEAPDADQFRERLSALEAHAGVGGPSSQAIKGSSSSTPSSAHSSGYDEAVNDEKLADTADSSPLRYGSGVVLGPVLHMPRFFIGENATDELAYGIAAAVRYSTGPTLSIIGELGYAGIGSSGASTGAAGPLLMAGLEARVPISNYASDHLVFRGGLGYERYIVSGTRAVANNALLRLGFGVRHVFGPSLAVEALIDGGPVYVKPDGIDGVFMGVVGGSFGFLVGF